MGLGFKDWTAGDVPTAAEFDGYLQRQTVMVFASTSARDTALSGNLEEGMHAFNTDDDELWYYDGSAWRLVSPKVYGCSVTRATDQTIAAGATDNVDWTAEVYDQGGFIAVTSDTITIPAGLGGVYSVSFRIKRTGGSGYVDGSSTVTVGGDVHTYTGNITSSSTDFRAFSWVGALSAADTITASVVEGSTSSSVNVQAAIEVYRIGRAG